MNKFNKKVKEKSLTGVPSHLGLISSRCSQVDTGNSHHTIDQCLHLLANSKTTNKTTAKQFATHYPKNVGFFLHSKPQKFGALS